MSDLSNEEILTSVRKIVDHALKPRMQQLMISKPAEYNKELQLTYPEFMDKCPSLFFTIMDNPKTFDMQRLHEMLTKRKQIANREISQEDADKKVGQEYYDEFIKPVVDPRDK